MVAKSSPLPWNMPRADLIPMWDRGKTVVITSLVCQLMDMKSITVRELHERTEQVVQQAVAADGFVITSHGEPLAIIKPVRGASAPRSPLPKRDASILPTTQFDSTAFISEDRNGR